MMETENLINSLGKKVEMTFLELGQKYLPNYFNKKLMEKGFKPHQYKLNNQELKYLLNAKKKLHYLPLTQDHIYSYHWGTGPEILLVHGWGGRGVQLSAFIDQLIANGFSVVTFDVPGHGDSEKKYTHIMEFIESLQVVSRSLYELKGIVSHSMGTTSSLKVIHDFFNTKDFKFVWIGGHFNLKNYFYNWGTRRGFPESILDNVFKAIENEFDANIDEIQAEYLGPHILADSLIIHDTDDKKCNIQNALKIHSQLPKAELHKTDGLGHYKIIKSQSVVRKVVDFLSN